MSNPTSTVSVTDVSCVKSGKDYYATVNGQRARLMVCEDGIHVLISKVTEDGPVRLGGWHLDRFSGSLSPQSIRAFYANGGAVPKNNESVNPVESRNQTHDIHAEIADMYTRRLAQGKEPRIAQWLESGAKGALRVEKVPSRQLGAGRVGFWVVTEEGTVLDQAPVYDSGKGATAAARLEAEERLGALEVLRGNRARIAA
ncbi:hypothetical protein [Marinimicrobium sp. ABcell2]|uniref:hypothetical protein n=1 Tax=Marinimicrobium sp. ABcell2 TaxID=3069751 RepID=UPI0027B3BAA8|nr:hypothetical protein [Marinimicrobium sp. ABcell2]MDQ2077450.1 hypothetical protein [Marinimicrobium sp. ABcell2]